MQQPAPLPMYALHLLPPQNVHHQHHEEGAREGEYGEEGGAPRPKHSNVYIQGLPTTIEEEQLAELCAVYGTVESLRVVRLKENYYAKLPFAFVKFSQIDEALAAIAAMNGSSIFGWPVEVRLADHDFQESSSADGGSKADQEPPPSANIYCKNLPTGFGEANLRQLFSPFGPVCSCRVLYQGDAMGNGGAALVRMASIDVAVQAVQALQGQRVVGALQPLVIRFADNVEIKAKKQAKQMTLPSDPASLQHMQQGSSSQTMPGPGLMLPSSPFINLHANGALPMVQTQHVASLYVANLPPDAQKLFLYELFAPFGAVLSTKILLDGNGNSRGVGFVNFADVECASRAVASLNNLLVGSRNLHVSFQQRKTMKDVGGPQQQQQHQMMMMQQEQAQMNQMQQQQISQVHQQHQMQHGRAQGMQ